MKGVKIAIENGADIHADNDSALIHSSNHGNLNIVKLLLKSGDKFKLNEPVFYAGLNNYPDVFELLLDYDKTYKIPHQNLQTLKGMRFPEIDKILKKYEERND